jgi:hypothetical protein
MCTPRAGDNYAHAHYAIIEHHSSLADDFFRCAGKWAMFAGYIVT